MDYEMEDFDLNDLVEILKEKIEESDSKSFEDIINLDTAINREIYLGKINDGVGVIVDTYIRFWNRYDAAKNIPVVERRPIKIYIDSPGGVLIDTFTMIDAIQMSKTPVWTIVTGSAYSGGFFTAIAGHKRFAYPHASFMMHEGGTQTGGDAHKFVNYTQFYRKELDLLKEHVLKCTNITNAFYEENKKDDVWFTSDEAIKYNIIDEIIKELI